MVSLFAVCDDNITNKASRQSSLPSLSFHLSKYFFITWLERRFFLVIFIHDYEV